VCKAVGTGRGWAPALAEGCGLAGTGATLGFRAELPLWPAWLWKSLSSPQHPPAGGSDSLTGSVAISPIAATSCSCPLVLTARQRSHVLHEEEGGS
jgi:hypothetical protein